MVLAREEEEEEKRPQQSMSKWLKRGSNQNKDLTSMQHSLSLSLSQALNPSQARFYSRRSTASAPAPPPSPRTRTTVLERERPQESESTSRQTLQESTHDSNPTQTDSSSASTGNDEPLHTSLTPGVVSHLRQVYGTLGATTGIATAGALVGMAFPISPLIPGLLALVPLFGIYMTDYRTASPSLRMGLLASFTALGGAPFLPLTHTHITSPHLMPPTLIPPLP